MSHDAKPVWQEEQAKLMKVCYLNSHGVVCFMLWSWIPSNYIQMKVAQYKIPSLDTGSQRLTLSNNMINYNFIQRF